MKQILKAFALALAFTSMASGQAVKKHEMSGSQKAEMSLYPTAEIQWKDGPASLPASAKFAVLEGDPSKEGFLQCAYGCRTVIKSHLTGTPK